MLQVADLIVEVIMSQICWSGVRSLMEHLIDFIVIEGDIFIGGTNIFKVWHAIFVCFLVEIDVDATVGMVMADLFLRQVVIVSVPSIFRIYDRL